METPKQLFETRVNLFLRDAASLSPAPFVTKPRSQPPRTVPPESPLDLGTERRRQLSSRMGGLKPSADGIRSASPFGLPKREGWHDQASRRSTGGVASSQVDPPQGGTSARVHRHRRSWCLFAAPASRMPLLPTVPPPAPLREVRLNGFPGALVGGAPPPHQLVAPWQRGE